MSLLGETLAMAADAVLVLAAVLEGDVVAFSLVAFSSFSFSLLSLWHSVMSCPLWLQCVHFLLGSQLSSWSRSQSRSRFWSRSLEFALGFPFLAVLVKNAVASSPNDQMRQASLARIWLIMSLTLVCFSGRLDKIAFC